MTPVGVRVRAWRWIRRWLPETTLLVVGVSLRASMRWTFKADWGWDASNHQEYVDWIVQHGALPPVDALRESFHPPLFYAVAAWLQSHGVAPANVSWFPIGCGVVRLALFWLALELYVPWRGARIAAMALIAVLPVSVHVDGMQWPEPVNGMFAMAAMVLIPRAFRRSKRLAYALVIGVLISLELLTKISAVICLAGIGITAIFELLWSSHLKLASRVRLALPWSAVLILPMVLTGWYFGPNLGKHDKLFLTSFDTSERSWVADLEATPVLDRRPLGFAAGWDNTIFTIPYMPSGLSPHPHFWPVIVASTFVDYYNYGFSGLDPFSENDFYMNGRPVSAKILEEARGSVAGGALIAVATLVAWSICLVSTWRRRDWGRHALLLITGLVVLATLHFTIKYPFDDLGVVKAAYIQFGAPSLCAMFGVAVWWSSRERLRWPIAGALLVSLFLVGSYTVYSRLRPELLAQAFGA
jgi:hypothetical protein